MRMTGETKLNMFFAAMLPYADKLAIRNLLANFGYDTRGKDITAAFCMKAYKEYGAEFGKPFASILRKAVESPRFQAERKLFMSSGLSRSNSTTNNKINLTTDQKVSLIDKGIDAALAIISGGMELGKSKYGNQAAQDEAEQLNAARLYMKQLQEQQNDNNNNTLKWVAVGGGAFLLVVVLVIVIVVAGKK